MQAVLIEHDQLALSELSAVVVSGGHRGENLIKDYDQVHTQLSTFHLTCNTQGWVAVLHTDPSSLGEFPIACRQQHKTVPANMKVCLLQGMNITLRRPIYNPNLLVPGADVAIDIPSIKTVLAESEYQFITSMAGDNFSEPLKVPQAAQWLQQYYSTDTMVASPEVSHLKGDRATSEQAEAALPTKQERFKQAVKAEKGETQKPQLQVINQFACFLHLACVRRKLQYDTYIVLGVARAGVILHV